MPFGHAAPRSGLCLVCFYSLFYKLRIHLASNTCSATLLLPTGADPPAPTASRTHGRAQATSESPVHLRVAQESEAGHWLWEKTRAEARLGRRLLLTFSRLTALEVYAR